MEFKGGCYCGKVRYKATGDPVFKGQCHCKECVHVAGGSPNLVMGMPEATFEYTQGEPKAFRRKDLDRPVTREFCAECGTQLVSRVPGMGMALIKVGTLDDPASFGGPQMAIYTIEKQSFHHIPEGIPSYDRLPT